jgi:hypothetical protein
LPTTAINADKHSNAPGNAAAGIFTIRSLCAPPAFAPVDTAPFFNRMRLWLNKQPVGIRKEGAMAAFRILLPYNYSPNDQKAIRFVIDAFAGLPASTVTLFHAYTPLPTIDASASPENVKLRSGMSYLAGELKEKEEALKVMGDVLVESGFARDAVACEFKRRVNSAAEEIVDRVAGCNVLVLSRGAGKVTHFFTRSIYARVVAALRGVTICVAT